MSAESVTIISAIFYIVFLFLYGFLSRNRTPSESWFKGRLIRRLLIFVIGYPLVACVMVIVGLYGRFLLLPFIWLLEQLIPGLFG